MESPLCQSYQGQLLLAVAQLRDPNFARTVVLMVEHNPQGALGLVLNRPLEMTIQEAWKKVSDEPCHCAGPLFQGGPCQGPLMAMHTHESAGQVQVQPGMHFTTEQEKVEWLLAHNQGPVKFFVGYAGWAPGQLEAEMKAGGWLTAPATAEAVFAAGGLSQWTRLMARLALGEWVSDRAIPNDPSCN